MNNRPGFLRAHAIMDDLPSGGYRVTVTSPDLPGVSEIYTIHKKSDSLAAQEAIRLFVEKHSHVLGSGPIA